jgi:hypothetical protein
MKKFIGTKIVQAEPASRLTFQKLGGPEMVVTVEEERVEANIEAAEESGLGLVRKQEGYKVIYRDGYESWSPKEVFEEAYRRTDGLNFGLAIEAAKMGKRIARKGWNGKGMSVAYQKGYPDGIPCNENTAKAWGMEVGELFKCRPYLQMRCADGSFQMWVASQTDMLAEDWHIVEG